MRPTFLGFRSPKERTPDPVLPRVTYDGRKLNYMSKRKAISFCKEKRFKNYDIQAKKTTNRVGPGSYSPTNGIAENKIPGGIVYKDLLGKKIVDGEGYFYVNNNLVFDSRLSKRSKHNLQEDIEYDLPTVNSFWSQRRRSGKGSVKRLTNSNSRNGKVHTRSAFFIKAKTRQKDSKSMRNLTLFLDERFKY